jgi:hypothetical protein
METVDEEFTAAALDFMDREHKAGKPATVESRANLIVRTDTAPNNLETHNLNLPAPWSVSRILRCDPSDFRANQLVGPMRLAYPRRVHRADAPPGPQFELPR